MKKIKKWCGDESDDLEEKQWHDEAEEDYRRERDEERERNEFTEYSDDDIDNIFRDSD